MESRFKTEMEEIFKIQKEKINKLNEEHEVEIVKYKKKIEELSENHINELKMMRENHERIVEEIKYEYSSMMENLKHTKEAESSMFEKSVDYGDKLEYNLKVLNLNTQALLEMKERFEKDNGTLSLSKMELLAAKEKETECKK